MCKCSSAFGMSSANFFTGPPSTKNTLNDRLFIAAQERFPGCAVEAGIQTASFESAEQAAGISVKLKIEVCRDIVKIKSSVVEVRQKICSLVPQADLEAFPKFVGKVSMKLVRGRPYQPQELAGFLTGVKRPVVEKLTRWGSNNELKTSVLQDLLAVRLNQMQLKQLFIGFKDEHTSGRLNAFSQDRPAIARSPSKVKNYIGLLDGFRLIELPGFALRIIRTVAGQTLNLHTGMAGPGCDGAQT